MFLAWQWSRPLRLSWVLHSIRAKGFLVKGDGRGWNCWRPGSTMDPSQEILAVKYGVHGSRQLQNWSIFRRIQNGQKALRYLVQTSDAQGPVRSWEIMSWSSESVGYLILALRVSYPKRSHRGSFATGSVCESCSTQSTELSWTSRRLESIDEANSAVHSHAPQSSSDGLGAMKPKT